MSRCCQGLNVLVGAEPVARKYLVLHINNPSGLVAKEKGEGIAWATNLLVPEFIENTIYAKVAEELQKQFKEKGSDLTVEVTSAPPRGQKPSSDLLGGVVLGLALALAGWGAVRLVSR